MHEERAISRRFGGDCTKANKVLGWKAEAKLEDVLASAWKWQRNFALMASCKVVVVLENNVN